MGGPGASFHLLPSITIRPSHSNRPWFPYPGGAPRAGWALSLPKWISPNHHQARDPGEAPEHFPPLGFQPRRIHKAISPPSTKPWPRLPIIQHVPAPGWFGPTKVYFLRNLSWLLLVHVPPNSSQAVCGLLREAIPRVAPSEPGSPQDQHQVALKPGEAQAAGVAPVYMGQAGPCFWWPGQAGCSARSSAAWQE